MKDYITAKQRLKGLHKPLLSSDMKSFIVGLALMTAFLFAITSPGGGI